MAEETKTVKRKSAAEKKPEETKKAVTIKVRDYITYKPMGCKAMVCGVDKTRKILYLDSPVSAWVAMSDCKA